MTNRFYGGTDPEEKKRHDEEVRKEQEWIDSWSRSYYPPPSLPYDGVSY